MRPQLTNARVTQEINVKVSWLTWEHFSPSHHLIYLATLTSSPWGSWKRMFWRSAPGIRNCWKEDLTHLDQKRLTFLKTCTIYLGFLFAVQRSKDKGWEQTFVGLFLCASQFESFLSFTLWVINIFIVPILIDLGKKCFWEVKSHSLCMRKARNSNFQTSDIREPPSRNLLYLSITVLLFVVV